MTNHTDTSRSDDLVKRLRGFYCGDMGEPADPINPDGPEAADRIEALEAENERLREALQFYAREYNWKSSGVYMCGHSNPSSAEIDRGNKARAALGEKQ